MQVFNPAACTSWDFTPFPGFAGGITVAAADVTGDGVLDFVVGAGPGGGPHVKVLDRATGLEAASFFAYDPGFASGVFVAANRDGWVAVGADAGGGARRQTEGRG